MIHRIASVALEFIPVQTRVPLKFGHETLTSVTCARVRVTVEDKAGRRAEGWGETPVSVQWVWPSALPYRSRHDALLAFCRRLGKAWEGFAATGHALEVGHEFLEHALPSELAEFNLGGGSPEPIPWLAALVCDSPFDLALHDAFGQLANRPTYDTYTSEFLSRDLSHYLEDASGSRKRFAGRFPADYIARKPQRRLRAWHLVGGLDALEASDLTGSEPDDGYPVRLDDWIQRDGLKCLKVKLRGNDADWDYARLQKVGAMAIQHDVEWLTADFNCTVRDPAYVNEMLDRLRDEQARIYGMILYVEQPFPYELEKDRIDAHGVAARKPLFLDESAHDWRMVRLGRELGWTGVALKTCKTQTGAILSACWAKAHGMTLMVQDLTNPMLAQIPHVLLAAHVGTVMGVETNAMQFYPEASSAEARVHPGLYRRRDGVVDLTTVSGPGFGYRMEDIRRFHRPGPEARPGPG